MGLKAARKILMKLTTGGCGHLLLGRQNPCYNTTKITNWSPNNNYLFRGSPTIKGRGTLVSIKVGLNLTTLSLFRR